VEEVERRMSWGVVMVGLREFIDGRHEDEK